MSKNLALAVSLILCLSMHLTISAQGNRGDEQRKQLKKRLASVLTENMLEISRKCNNSFFFLVYTVDPDSVVSVDLIGTDTTMKKILLESNLGAINDQVLQYARSVSRGKVLVVQPFYIGCQEYQTWIDMNDLNPLFYRLEKAHPGTKIFLEYQDFDRISKPNHR